MEKVKRKRVDLRLMVYLLMMASFFSLLTACSKHVSKKWQEEIRLSDGRVIWVERTVSYLDNNQLKGLVPTDGSRLTKMASTITFPSNSIIDPPPNWRVKSDVIPMLLDYDSERKSWFIVANTLYCDAWVKDWGKPKYNYGQYIVKNNKWIVVPLDEKLIGRKPNMFTNITNKDFNHKKITIDDIRKDHKSMFHSSSYKVVRSENSSCGKN